MISELRWLIPLSLTLACDGGAAPQPPKKDAEPAASAATRDSADAAMEPTTKAPVAPPAVEEEWLVWFDSGSGLQSRWYTTTQAGTKATASRSAVVVADGETLWHVRRKDAKAEVFGCECFESEQDPACRKTGSVNTLGLEAAPMGGGTPVSLETAEAERIYGEVDALTLSLEGGVGAWLMVATSDAGYYCGAHGSYGGATHLHDVSAGARLKWPEVKLPEVMMKEAALSEGMLKNYKECWDEPSVTMDGFIRDQMDVVAVKMSLEAGMVRLRWHAEAEGPYVCTGDYAFHGYVETTLLPPASKLGLAPPLSAGLQAALQDVGDASVVGWSKLERTGSARDEALAWFAGLDETPWAPGKTNQVDSAKAPQEDTKASRALLAKGRKLTKAKDYAGADKALSQAIKLDPEAARPYAARCYARLLAETYKSARADCDKALTLHPGDRFAASVHYNLGTLSVREGNTAQARASYEASLALRDNDTVRHALQSLE
ncbi:MAG: tetratricopeptide repeat protein [Nannocystales bacterium]